MNPPPRTVFSDLRLMGHDEDFEGRLPAQRCDWPAGSIEKIEVMRLRVLAGESLWHPGDNQQSVAPTTERVRRVESRGLQITQVILGRHGYLNEV